MAVEIAVILAALTLAGLLKGATGIGLPLVGVPAIAAFTDVPNAVAILALPILATNLWQIRQFRDHRAGLPFLPPLLVSAAVGIVLGTWLLTRLPSDTLSAALGLLLLVYVGMRLARPDFRLAPALAHRIALPVGFVSGALQGSTGVSAPVSVSYFSALRLDRPRFVFGMSALFLAFSAVQIPSLVAAGVLTGARALIGLVALLPIAGAMVVGQWAAGRLSAKGFDRLLLLVLLVIAAKILGEAAFGG